MNKEFYVVKFGEKYYKEMSGGGGATVLALVDDFADAHKYKDLNRETIQRLLDLGGSVLEVRIYEYDRTFSLMMEWEKEVEE